MDITLKDIIGLVKELPEKSFAEALEKISEIKEKAEKEKEFAPIAYHYCGSSKV